jgi:regulator of protease activity HflC (stomatin/prohibitin superfamily)
MSTLVLTILVIVVVLVALAVAVRRWCVSTIPPATMGIVERRGQSRILGPGPHVVIPGVDRVRTLVDMREQTVPHQPQQVLTSDNVRLKIEAVVWFQVTDASMAVYQVADYMSDLEQLTSTTLGNVASRMDMETALRSRDQFSSELMTELGHATRGWGLQVTRAELKTLARPSVIQESMERQRAAEHDKNATDLVAQAQANAIVTRAMAEVTADAVWTQGQAEGIIRVFQAIAEGNPNQRLLIYEWLKTQTKRPPVGSPEVGQVRPDGQELGSPRAQPLEGSGTD